MEIQKIGLEYCKKDNTKNRCEGICHVKTLPYLSVVQSVEGSYDIRLGTGATYQTGEGGFFVAPADVKQTIVHHVNPETGTMTNRWVFLKIRLNDACWFDELYSVPTLLPDEKKAEMNCIFDRLFDTVNPFSEYVCYYEIVRILSEIAREKEKKKGMKLGVAISYIHTHYREKITVELLAEMVHLSASRFFSAFKKATGASPIAYLNHYRLSVASELLSGSDMRISEISDAVGIEDSIYFNKLFRKHYQMSPSRYREVYRKL